MKVSTKSYERRYQLLSTAEALNLMITFGMLLLTLVTLIVTIVLAILKNDK